MSKKNNKFNNLKNKSNKLKFNKFKQKRIIKLKKYRILHYNK